ncbi:flavodoxin family protein [Clostridium paridis]|uniref:Flavodoxin family protein n=1 Tax=Clostridium paridis TaxID=2803863 RepID=A0A937K5R1_9CLOT|nr:flavodoxin family protein [Clostridium paridis]MBL4933329.1 flavodoxin family protein [Clostridium paridis]
MKILTIIGSPKGKGNTYDTALKVETTLKKINDKIEFEYLYLKDVNLLPCKGCFQCFLKGEQFCPLKDDRELIERKMVEADGVIFATPVYAYNLTWLMKSFIDRFAYVCHRPRFHNKKAMVIVTTGAVGLDFVLFNLAQAVGTWGYSVVSKLGVMYPPEKILEEQERKLRKKTEKNIKKAATKFYFALKENKVKKPNFLNVLAFRLQKDAFSRKDQNLADYKYWKGKGWIEKETKFYYSVKINIIIRVITSIIAKIVIAKNPKPEINTNN